MEPWTIRPILPADCMEMYQLHVAAIHCIDDAVYIKDIRES